MSFILCGILQHEIQANCPPQSTSVLLSQPLMNAPLCSRLLCRLRCVKKKGWKSMIPKSNNVEPRIMLAHRLQASAKTLSHKNKQRFFLTGKITHPGNFALIHYINLCNVRMHLFSAGTTQWVSSLQQEVVGSLSFFFLCPFLTTCIIFVTKHALVTE